LGTAHPLADGLHVNLRSNAKRDLVTALRLLQPSKGGRFVRRDGRGEVLRLMEGIGCAEVEAIEDRPRFGGLATLSE
jgi:hypothetical protein